MRKQVLAATIGIILILSFFAVLQWQIKPVQATTLFSSDFSTVDFADWTSVTGAPERISYNGGYAMNVSADGNYLSETLASASGTTYFTFPINMTYFAYSGSSARSYQILKCYDSDGHSGVMEFLVYQFNSVKYWKLVAKDNAGGSHEMTNDTPAINLEEEYSVTLEYIKNTVQGCRLWIDNDLVAQMDAGTTYNYNISDFRFGAAYFDDVLVTHLGATFSASDMAPTFLSGNPEGIASDWTYRIYKNTTAAYAFDASGTAIYSDADLSASQTVFNNAIADCAGGGSVYVLPATYNTTGPIGSSGNFEGDNIFIQFGDNALVQRTSGSGEGDFLLCFRNFISGITNLTITSNGTAYFNSSGYGDGLAFRIGFNSTFSNLHFSHMASGASTLTRLRYCNFYNLTFYSWDESFYGQTAFGGSDIQYSNFDNVTIDGANQAKTRVGFYLSDWEDTTGWNGSYFNTIQRMWIKNLRRDGIYLNSGAAGNHVYNNTFSNCTIENNWEAAYDAIKLRPSINCTLTDIVIRNWTDAVTTGTSYDDEGSADGNCTGNYVEARIYGTTVTSLILTADGNNKDVSGNFFNLTVENGKGTWFSQGTNSLIHDNIVYMNFTDCTAGIYLEQGNISDNTFYLNFTRCGSGGHPDIWHYSGWTNITGNTFNVYATSGNPNGLYDFVNGTQGNIVIYPYAYSGPPPVLVTIDIKSPTNSTYASSTITLEIDVQVSGSTLDTVLYNVDNASVLVYVSNQTYTVVTQMTGIVNGEHYTLYVWANATDGTEEYATVMFSVSISAEGIVSIYVNTWWSNYW